MKVALYQMNIIWENKTENFIKAENAMVQAGSNGADIIFFPEMSFTGFSMNIGSTAENDFFTLTKMKELCTKYNIAAGFGWVKECGKKAQNCYTVLNSSGNELSTYVKIHPFSYSNENDYFEKGCSLTKFKINNTTFSTAICYDTRFPELFQGICKDNEVTAIVIPANWPSARADHWKVLTQARAIENQVYILAVNCVGSINGIYYSGNSCIIDPNGKIMAHCENSEEIIYSVLDIDVQSLRNKFPVKKDRQIELYKNIL